MHIAAKIALGLAVGLVSLPLIAYNFYPGKLLKQIYVLQAKKAKLIRKEVKIESTNVVYYEGGNLKGPSVVMIHGFSASKEGWLQTAAFLSSSFHLFLIDLPGHGESSRIEENKHNVTHYVSTVAKFAAKVGLGRQFNNPFHILGLSMGGMISGIYSASFPQDLISATLMCPAGLPTSPELTEFQKTLDRESTMRILVPSNEAEFDKQLKTVSYKKIAMPRKFKEHLVKKSQNDAKWIEKLWREVVLDTKTLDVELPKIKVPVLVLWGDKDEILHVSGADLIKEKVARCERHVFTNCGHLIGFEQPQLAANTFTHFAQQAGEVAVRA